MVVFDPHHDPRSDEQLVQAVMAGDEAAFTALYHRHKNYVHRVARRFCPDDALAQDAVQETFVYLARKLADPGFKLTAQLTSLLYPAAKHAALSQAQRLERQPRSASEDLPEPVAEAPPAEDPRQTLTSALACLPDPQREVVLLRFVDDLPLQVIADRLAVPLGTVKSRLSLAIKALRQNPGLKHFFH